MMRSAAAVNMVLKKGTGSERPLDLAEEFG
jgi:hypothetical protein